MGNGKWKMEKSKYIQISINGGITESEVESIKNSEGITIMKSNNIIDSNYTTEILAMISVVSASTISNLTKIIIEIIKSKRSVRYKDNNIEINGISSEKLSEILNNINEK